MNNIYDGGGANYNSNVIRYRAVGPFDGIQITKKALPTSKTGISEEKINVSQVSMTSSTAQPLARRISWNLFSGLILILFSILFFMFGITAWHLHGTQFKDDAERLRLVSFGNKVWVIILSFIRLILTIASSQRLSH
jgi:magnesium-transporting ATPase (P-type)